MKSILWITNGFLECCRPKRYQEKANYDGSTVNDVNQSEKLHFFDNEFAGNRLIYFALVNCKGEIALNVIVDYDMGLDERKAEFSNPISKKSVEKYYGQSRALLRTNAERLKPLELVGKLEAVSFENLDIVEWSFSYCDWRMMKQLLRESGRADLIPAKSACAYCLLKDDYFYKDKGLQLEKIFP